jgi:hypothetical protein
MALKKATRASQRVSSAQFAFNFDDTVVNTSGATVDFGSSNTSATTAEVINLPKGAIVVGGALTRSTAFDAATYNVTVGDADSAARYLGSTDVKATGITALVPTGYVSTGQNIRLVFTAADVCTTGVAHLRVDYIINERADEVNPN